MIDYSAPMEQFLIDAARMIGERLGGRATPRDITRHLWRFRNGGECLLASMEQRGWGRWEIVRPGPKGGRPSRVFVLNDAIGETEVGAVGAQKGNERDIGETGEAVNRVQTANATEKAHQPKWVQLANGVVVEAPADPRRVM